MRVKLAGFPKKRTFCVYRVFNGKQDFVPMFMMPTLTAADRKIEDLSKSNDPCITWKAHVLLDDGDWFAVTPEFRNSYREDHT
jgi:hypothetical protein